MSTKIRDLLELDDEKEAENAPPAFPPVEIGSSSYRGVIEKQIPKEEMQLSRAKDVKLEQSPVTLKDVSANEDAAADLLPNVEQNAISASLVVSPDEKSEVSEETDSSKPPYSLGSESFKMAEKSLSSSRQDSLKSGEISLNFSEKIALEKPSRYLEQQDSKSSEKGHNSSSKGEESKSEECTAVSSPVIAGGWKPEKTKRTARLQSNETVSDTLKDTTVKFTALKSCPSVDMEVIDLNISPGVRSNSSGHHVSAESAAMMDEAWDRLKKSYVYYKGKPVGTLAAIDPSAEALNYNQVFVRDFVPSGLACLMKLPSEPEIVKDFLLKTLHLQGWEKRIDNFTLGEGVMPASFKVIFDSHRHKEELVADFGGSAIGRVAPVDSGFWWIILLRSYTKSTHDYALADLPEVQRGMKLILNLCLSDGFDTFPTLLCADGCSMIDRRMGIYGYPIEIQALFYFALRCARQILKPERDGKELLERIDKRITALSYHIQKYYWLDFTQLNNIYRYKTEEYSRTAVNKFNVIPESIPDWVFDFMPLRGGYLIGNVSPARMDFRWFLVGNCIAILSSLVTPAQATAIMDLVEERWEDLIGEMPLKITYPALEGLEWKIVTGWDPKNTRWSYHNGGSWPVLLWLLAAASIKVGRPQIAKRAVELVEQRLSKDGWPEYYDDKTGRYVGKQARKYQTWSIAGYLVAKLMIENPSNLLIISLEEDKKIAKPRIARSTSF